MGTVETQSPARLILQARLILNGEKGVNTETEKLLQKVLLIELKQLAQGACCAMQNGEGFFSIDVVGSFGCTHAREKSALKVDGSAFTLVCLSSGMCQEWAIHILCRPLSFSPLVVLHICKVSNVLNVG